MHSAVLCDAHTDASLPQAEITVCLKPASDNIIFSAVYIVGTALLSRYALSTQFPAHATHLYISATPV